MPNDPTTNRLPGADFRTNPLGAATSEKQMNLETDTPTQPDSAIRTIWEGVGYFALGFVGFLASFWLAGQVKAVVGIATLYGSGLIGYGAWRLVFRERFPRLAWVAAIAAALVGLLLTLLVLFLILGADFI